MEPTLETFTAQALDEGFDEILVREWAPGLELDTHTHAFAVSARVVRGEFWLTVDGSTRHIPAGQGFRLRVMCRIPSAMARRAPRCG